MKVWTLFILSLLFFGCSHQQKLDSDSAQLYLNLGASQLQQGHPHRALKNLLKAQKLDEENAQINNHLGLAYFTLTKYKQSVKYFSRALSQNKAYTEARVNLGRALVEVGRYDEARMQLEIATQDLTYSHRPKIQLNLGLSYFRQRSYQKALPLFQAAARVNKTNCFAHHFYARTLLALNEFQSANGIFDIALPLCKKINYDEAHFFAAISYFKSGDKPRGIALMNETILHYPNGPHNRKAQKTLELMKLNKL